MTNEKREIVEEKEKKKKINQIMENDERLRRSILNGKWTVVEIALQLNLIVQNL